MRTLFLTKLLVIGCLCSLLACAPAYARVKETGGTTASGSFPILVNGRTLTGPESQAQERGGKIYVPVVSIASALGHTISVDTSSRTIKVIRQTGVTAIFDSSIGQVLENGSAILAISNSNEIGFTPNGIGMMLPLELASSLFEVSMHYDVDQKTLIVRRGIAGPVQMVQTGDRSFGELYFAEYEYGMGRYANSFSQNLMLRGTGRLGDGHFTFSSISSSQTLTGFTPRNVNFALIRPNGQRYVAGDIGPGTAMPLMNSNIRGALVEIPVGDYAITSFVGKTRSGHPQFDTAGPAPRQGFAHDTLVYGAFVTTDRFGMTPSGKTTLSAGAMRFSGAGQTGQMVSASGIHADRRLRLQADVAFGSFRGTSIEGKRADGTGEAIDIAATYQATDGLSLQSRFTHVGRNFLTAQRGQYQPVDTKAIGASWSPTRWLTTTFNASSSSRPDDKGRGEKYATASFAITPRAGLPRLNITHTQSSSRMYRSGSFTLVNAATEISHWRIYANASRLKTTGLATMNLQVGAQYALSDRHSFEVSQLVGSGGSRSGTFDWRASGMFNGRLSFAAGSGYTHSQNGTTPFGRMSASFRLPRDTSVQLNYMQGSAGPVLLVQIKGALFKKRQASTYLNSTPTEVVRLGSVSGRVYKDIDGDGSYDPSIDKAQSGVQVRVDGNRYVETDANGGYVFDALTPGEHRVYLDLASVRADLTLIDGSTRKLDLMPGAKASTDFRLVQTGRISGRVFFDANGNGKLDGDEQPLADVRVVMASGRDTMTDERGFFTISDLTPGEHIVMIDEKTLPEKTVSATKSLSVQVFAGRETGDVTLVSIPRPAEVKRFGTH